MNFKMYFFHGIAVLVLASGAWLLIDNLNAHHKKVMNGPAPVFNITATQDGKIGLKGWEKFTEHLSNEIKRQYDISVAHLTFTVTYFSLTISALLIIVGFISFGRISQLAKLAETVESQPEKILGRYYDNRLRVCIDEIFSKDTIKRQDAIKELALNPGLSKKNYDLLNTALDSEMKSPNNLYFYPNIANLVIMMMRLDQKDTLEKVLDLIEKYRDDQKVFSLVPHIFVENNAPAPYKERIKKLLVGSSSTGFGNVVLHNLINSGSMDMDYAKYIIEKSEKQSLLSFIMTVVNSNTSIKLLDLKDDITARGLDQQFYSFLLVNTIHPNSKVPASDSIEIIVDFIKKSTNSSEVDATITNAVSQIRDRSDILDSFFASCKNALINPALFIRLYNASINQPYQQKVTQALLKHYDQASLTVT